MHKNKIKSYVKELTKCDNIEYDTLLLENKILDSLHLIQLIMFLEKEFNISLKQEVLIPDNFQTLNTICELIEKSIGNPFF